MKNEPVWFESVKDKKRFNSLKKSINVNVAVIGGGIVGVSSAYFLSKKFKVALIEKNHIGTGDSGYSTAFLTRTPDASAGQIAKKYGQKFLNELYEGTGKAQKELFKIIKSNRIKCGFVNCSSYYLTYKKDKSFEKEWDYIKQADKNTEFIGYDRKLGIKFADAIRFKNEGKFDIRKYLLGLVSKLEIDVFEETNVVSIENKDKIIIKTENGTIKADKVIVAVGNPSSLINLKLVEPILSYVLALECKVPLSDDIFWDTFEPYYYYRKVNDKLMLVGGCDNQKFDDKAYDKLEKFAHEKFGKFKIKNKWSGTQFKTKDNIPYIFEHKKNIFVATGFNGSGLVFGTLTGMIMNDFCLGKKNKYSHLFSLKRFK